MAETLDPRSTWSVGRASPDDVVFVEILFHSDLRRIGDVLVLGPASRAHRIEELGRDGPQFAREGSLRALEDPCVSRRQLSIAWGPASRTFAVEPLADARRPLACFDARAVPREGSLGALPPDSLLAIGDRVLMRLACGPLHVTTEPGAPLGNSAMMTALREQIHLLGRSELPVLIRGETGVGKELVARALHNGSARKAKPMLALNCAALPEQLVESELFGHQKGVFSGAGVAREGLFRSANGGTLLLDEIGELPLAVQAKLLRVLEERAVRPLGEAREVPIDVRLLAATHRPLEDDVAAGRFRADLFARIEAPALVIPPLRERPLDTPRLFAHFLMRADSASNSVEAEALRKVVRAADSHPPRLPMAYMLVLLRHGWPRNVREVEKAALATLLAAARTGTLAPPWPVGAAAAPPEPPAPASASTLPTARERPATAPPNAPPTPARGRPTREALVAVLEAHDYVQSRVAAELDVSRTTLDKWMREHEIRRPKDVADEELAEAVKRARGDLAAAARELGISERGLRLRLGASRGE